MSLCDDVERAQDEYLERSTLTVHEAVYLAMSAHILRKDALRLRETAVLLCGLTSYWTLFSLGALAIFSPNFWMTVLHWVGFVSGFVSAHYMRKQAERCERVALFSELLVMRRGPAK